VRPARRPAARERAAQDAGATVGDEQAALRAQLDRTLRAADAALALRLAFEQLAERTRTAMLMPQLALAIDGELRPDATLMLTHPGRW
jgi:hypothetical protein